jgi:hypothetical protein
MPIQLHRLQQQLRQQPHTLQQQCLLLTWQLAKALCRPQLTAHRTAPAARVLSYKPL